MKSPAFNSDWTLGQDAFFRIVKRAPRPVRKMIEFGSGVSTIRFAQKFQEATIYSFEHDEEYLQKTQAMAVKYGVAPRVRLIHYDPTGPEDKIKEELAQAREADLCLIDGPPAAFADGRSRMGLLAIPFVRQFGLIVLDDHRRRPEKLAVAEWRKTYSLAFTQDAVGHGVAFLEKL